MAGLEREIKLQFASPEEARAAVRAAGLTPRRARRLQHDALYDSDGAGLQARRSVLRIRTEDGQSRLTFKGPPQPSRMKLREELETAVEDGGILHEVLTRLGFRVWFRYQKYREEFDGAEAIVAIDETPIGVYIEVEGSEAGIGRVAAALGRSPDAYILDSYRGLFAKHRASRGLAADHMVFEP